MTEQPINIAELRQENEQLRNAVEKLVYEIEAQRRMDNYDIPTGHARADLPESKSERDPILPPWEREGFDSKEEWQAAQDDAQRDD